MLTEPKEIIAIKQRLNGTTAPNFKFPLITPDDLVTLMVLDSSVRAEVLQAFFLENSLKLSQSCGNFKKTLSDNEESIEALDVMLAHLIELKKSVGNNCLDLFFAEINKTRDQSLHSLMLSDLDHSNTTKAQEWINRMSNEGGRKSFAESYFKRWNLSTVKNVNETVS